MAKRNLYLKTISVEEAYDKYMQSLNGKKIFEIKKEIIDTKDALGRVTSDAIFAKCNSPLFNAASMDGICVEAKKTKGASEENPVILTIGSDFKIVDTGDAIMKPFDAVIMAEDVIEVDDNTIKIISPVPEWQHVRPVGEDIATNEMIIESNHEITPIDIGAILASGNTRINCYKKICVGIIPTGTEIIEPKEDANVGDIFDSNSYMIKALVEKEHVDARRYDIVKDDYDRIKQQILKSVKENDITIVNAGSSAGTEDFTVHILREIGEVVVHGVSMKPGKPVILAIVDGKPVIGLPGYPLSAYLAFDLFVKPIIAKMSGRTIKADENIIEANISRRIVSSLKHREYVRVKVGKVEDKFIASPLNRGAASQMSMVRADGMLIIPQNSEGVEAGDICQVKLFKDIKQLENTIVSIGSHDILMDMVSDILAKDNSKFSLSSTHVGSLAGLMTLKRNETLIAPTHLLDEETGIYNISIIKELFGEGKVSIIKGFDRIQGIMVKKGNPLNVKGVQDLICGKFVHRQRGSGTRVLFDYKLKECNISIDKIDGYDKEVSTHMAVAAQVKSGDADFGIGIKSVAQSMGLDFIEIGIEEYDFAVYTKNLDDDRVKEFYNIITGKNLKDRLEKYGGYGFRHIGEIINV